MRRLTACWPSTMRIKTVHPWKPPRGGLGDRESMTGERTRGAEHGARVAPAHDVVHHSDEGRQGAAQRGVRRQRRSSEIVSRKTCHRIGAEADGLRAAWLLPAFHCVRIASRGNEASLVEQRHTGKLIGPSSTLCTVALRFATQTCSSPSPTTRSPGTVPGADERTSTARHPAIALKSLEDVERRVQAAMLVVPRLGAAAGRMHQPEVAGTAAERDRRGAAASEGAK